MIIKINFDKIYRYSQMTFQLSYKERKQFDFIYVFFLSKEILYISIKLIR